MASTSGLSVSGNPFKLLSLECNLSLGASCIAESNHKKRRVSRDTYIQSVDVIREIKAYLPSLQALDYYTKPSLEELVFNELLNPGYCSQVPNFTVGRIGYGSVKYPGKTDVRGLDLNKIVKFHRHEVVVYEDKSVKPLVGQGLNKAAEVTLIINHRSMGFQEPQADNLLKKLRRSSERQGAHFISFDSNGELKFSVKHFSRFGFNEDDEDIVMDDANTVQDDAEINGDDIYDIVKETQINATSIELSHSLPAHLRLDPEKMREMRMFLFPEDEEDVEDLIKKTSFSKEQIRPLQSSSKMISHRSSPPVPRKTPLALLEYNHGSFESSSPEAILMSHQHKGMPLKAIKAEGFKLDLHHDSVIKENHSCNIVDAGLFMGRSFRVGWGPNGVLMHAGAPVGSDNSHKVLSSVINLEKVAIDNVVRDANNKVSEELVDLAFDSALNIHNGISHKVEEIEVEACKLRLQKLLVNRNMLSEICRSYVDLLEKEMDVSGLSSSARLSVTHQVMVWELIRVLFSEREYKGQMESLGADNEENMMQDMNEASQDVDLEALPLVRRAEFSYWLQESVSYHVQNDISSLNESDYLEHIFVLLSGRQLDAAVELAVSKGDVRLACLLSQAGGSTVNRSDVARQLDLWRINGLDFTFIEKARIRLFELLAGNIHGALLDIKVDWRRFLGLLMWYQLPPNTSLPVIFQTYKNLLDEGKAPYPVPLFIDEGPQEDVANWSPVYHFDLMYYLMLLHASEERDSSFLKAMFSAFSSTCDPLDYHMIWHQRAILEAVGAVNSNDLHLLDMGLVSQLLCLGKCHLAIYVVLHMPYVEDYPFLHVNLIREILFQYVESWSLQESQIHFIENLGVPMAWLHEAMAVYHNYNGDLPKALEHFIECENWQKAHSLFVTSIAHKLFLSGKNSDIWRLATSMENHKSEIENWELGAGIYITFYWLSNSLRENDNSVNELDSLESKNVACREFIGQLNESLAVWGGRLPVDARVAYSKMSEEICSLLLLVIGKGRTRDEQFSCFETVFAAPTPVDIRSSHLQDAVSLFTCFLSEVAT